ncbi:tRNA (adenosine(37)-N6)-threonylcarbamoyltransferase complex ATPase subunit type 1 TsaE [Blastopirellula sp. JC732]|uniref:tRNA threonylcarbamoyladenosine biosynthesis protein TsaE n=1 Tax=Blastopirellula sediminis TaxID=2894196 RepID=A0A9X1SEN3_9BACT|nr:tRNA (adenosine(37)-N6)-threonylcarbamoyltransferase complex ATPase subunit type 1 TsaE [Blastopirellula sediminis]MCC9607804.1 tRNA (adenosine(37)-N6)-threonylcarbamoyltransferase complex ATPase subunit type 1 TsaE [Blastopirellula sediminis]MCC9627403.1 tRNA (adenosine(37)-N6)-threonylcarbamoyltransferase complex ATPase subunit type 1 TsaE [Blastopirellula sediminis]
MNDVDTRQLELTLTSEADTDRLGGLLAELLPDGTTVALLGTLGAGKTRLVKAIASACEIDPQAVISPTFVLVQEYDAKRQLYHMDAYRIKDDDEFLELGPEEYFNSEGITFVEWADRVIGCMPRSYVEIEIFVTGETDRRVVIAAKGKAPAEWLATLASRWQ